VPNVDGTAGADIIQADNGNDRINGRAGGDNLYPAAGNNVGFKTGLDRSTPRCCT
jgi:hypothetical protein